jgi:uncharacterized membrane protein (DUF4010 family)
VEPAIFRQLGLSVLLGLLVGLEREHAASGIAGMRTFPLITLLGTVAAMLAAGFGGWIVAAGLLGVVALIAVGHLQQPPDTQSHRGITTDAALLMMYAVGALLTIDGMTLVAIVIGGVVAVLLQFKPELHSVAQKLGDADLRAIMQFVLITCIILPVLPNRTYGPLMLLGLSGDTPDPLAVLNPYEIWFMVVLIVGMSLGGYIAYKFLGRDAGILLGGMLGGAISSTATTVSYARSAPRDAVGARIAAVVILIASTVMYVRVLIAILIVSPDFFRHAVVPILIVMGLTLLPAGAVWFRLRRESPKIPEQENPTQLKSALVFGLLYAVVLFALAAAKQYFGDRGLYLVAGLSGLSEMDAITLSTARMSLGDPSLAAEGWRMIVVAAMTNLVSKTLLAGLLGGWRLLISVAALFSVPLAGGIALLWLW